MVRGMQCVQSVGNGFIRSAYRVRHTECINAFPTGGGEHFGYNEAWANTWPELASLSEGGARRAEGVSCVIWEWLIIPNGTPSVSEADSMNRGMIATGNHGNFDSLRGAQPQRGSQGAVANIDNIRFKLNKTDKHILLSISSGLTLRMGYIRALLPFCVQPLHLGPELQERLDNDGVKVPAAALPDDVKAGIQRQSIPVASLGGNRVKHDGQSAADQNGGKVG